MIIHLTNADRQDEEDDDKTMRVICSHPNRQEKPLNLEPIEFTLLMSHQ